VNLAKILDSYTTPRGTISRFYFSLLPTFFWEGNCCAATSHNGDLVSHQRRHLSRLLFGLRHPPWIRAGELVCADRRENRHEESEPRGQ
jgi:hypothetical protein